MRHLTFSIVKHIRWREKASRRSLFSQTGQWQQVFGKAERKELEDHWRQKIADHHVTQSSQRAAEGAQKYYVLSMFPYPSGRLHMGHVRVYSISDAMARYHRLTGKYVVHPMGWDSFGLPAENAAIERGELPSVWTASNIKSMKKQLEELCCSFDWDREISTCDPEYYRWTQYIFLKMYDAGLVYQKLGAVNWDPVDQTVLADEQIDEEGRSWRSGAKVEKKFLKQWYIKTTAYSKSLYDGLGVVDAEMWKDVIQLQQNWIGECKGVRFNFKVQNADKLLENPISLYTEHPECILGASHIDLSPDHPLNMEQYYRPGTEADEEDIELTLKAVHPFVNRLLPLYVRRSANFGEYLDCHLGIPECNKDDGIFAEYHSLPHTDPMGHDVMFSGKDEQHIIQAIIAEAKLFHCGGDITSEKARDWLISRQRYWGTPIPMIHCPKYGTMPVPVEDLPVTLPKVTSFTGKGSSPLANEQEWVMVKCPKCDCDGYALRETDTMDTFVDSSWYFLRYLDPNNKEYPFYKEAAKSMPVDLYIGGKEHAIMHLYYARFFNHFLHDLALVPYREPFVHLLTQGMVMGRSYRLPSGKYLPPGEVDLSGEKPVQKGTGEALISEWEKMSKSKYNGVDPQDVMDEFGTDCTRLCILSNVAPKSDRNWSDDALVGILRWQNRVWKLVHEFIQSRGGSVEQPGETLLSDTEEELFEIRNYFLKEVSHHMEKTFLLSVAISRLQGLSNALKRFPPSIVCHSAQFERTLAELVIMLSPFAPMFAAELWTGISSVKHKLPSDFHWDQSVFDQKWPTLDKRYRPSLKVKLNNKDVYEVRLQLPLEELHNITKDEALRIAKSSEHYAAHVENANIVDHSFLVESGLRVELTFISEDSRKGKKKKRRDERR